MRMFSLAYVILPFSDTPPADAIRASLARFQRGGRGDLPEGWLTFRDETEEFRGVHEAHHIFTEHDTGGLGIKGDIASSWFIDTVNIRTEMRLNGVRQWHVRFADTMDLAEFYERFGRELERHPDTGAFGRWLNPLGRWDWWDLGGRFDGMIVGDRRSGMGRSVAQVSSGPSRGRAILANIEDQLADALGQQPIPSLDARTDQNVELVSTLLEDARAGRENAVPGSLVLPPGAVEDGQRWLDRWPEPGPEGALAGLGLSAEAGWAAIVTAAYARIEDHWAAGVAYHH
ncbi:MAG TPA: hypothetical protein VGG99_04190 [Acetobacteraceae bacterium]